MKDDELRREWSSPYFIGNRVGIIMLHGFTSAPDMFYPLRDQLIASGYSTATPLLSGHGSHPDALQSVCYQDWLMDADTAYTELNRHCSHFIIVGVSLGATLALDLAKRYDNIIGLIIINPLLCLPGLEGFYQEIIDSPDEYLARIEAPTDAAKDCFYYPYYPAKIYREVLKLSAEIFNQLNKIRASILHFTSSADSITSSNKIANRILTEVNSRSKVMITLNGASYHQSFDHNDYALISQLTRDFIRYQLSYKKINPRRHRYCE